MHRQESDAGNANHWFQRAGAHAIFPALREATIAAGQTSGTTPPITAGTVSGQTPVQVGANNSYYETLVVNPPAPAQNFTLVTNYNYAPTSANANLSVPIATTCVNGFSGALEFTAVNYNSQYGQLLAGSPQFSSWSIPCGASSTLTIPVYSAAQPGNYNVTVWALAMIAGQPVQQSTTLGVTVTTSQAAGIAATPYAQTLAPGGAPALFQVGLIAVSNFSGTVTLSCGNSSLCTSRSFSPLVLSGGVLSSIMTVSVAVGTAPGVYTIDVSGTSNGQQPVSTNVQLTVSGPSSPSFTLQASPFSWQITPGGSGSSTVTAAPANGFAGNVSLSCAGLPAGVTAGFAPNPITSATGYSGTLTLSAGAAVSAGTTASCTLTGTGGSAAATTLVQARVVAPANLISNVLTVSAPTKVTVPNNGQTLTAQIEFVHVPGDPYGDFSSGSCSTWDPNLSVWFDEIEGYNLSVYFYATGLAQLGEYPIGETCICDDDSCFFDLPPVDVQDMPNVTMLVNGSADIGAAVTTVNPVQTVPIQITANGANLTAVALSVTPAGRASLDRYTLNLTNHQPVTVTLTPLAPSQTPYDVQITAIWQNVEVAQASLTIVGAAISRQSLTQFSTSGSPQGGTFSYAAGYLSGSSSFLGEPGIQFSAGVAAQTNPNLAVLSNPANSCANQVPCAGVISAISADYSMPPENQFVLPTTAAGQFNVATFGLSCYYTTAQQQWGAAPDACSTVTIQSVTYSGVASVSPPGLPDGRYCNAFLAELALQGSASLTDGTLVQYSPSLRVVSVITGADGTPVQAGQTIARDRNIIPGIGVLVDINGLGTGLLANDTGGAIRGYRIDYYNGVGPSACSGFSNIMGVSDCNPGNATCPSSTSVVQ